MIKFVSLWLIDMYQRFVSPHKRFHCAHHQLHHKDTCSNAVKQLIAKHGPLSAWPKIRQRFADCRSASLTLNQHQADLPIPCDVGIGDCGGISSPTGTACTAPCDLLWPIVRSPRGLLVVFLVSLILGYWFYGRGIGSVEVSQLQSPSTNLFTRLSQRNEPNIRVLIEADGKKYYSNIATLKGGDKSITLEFDKAPLSYHIDTVKILDARINIANDLLVVVQVLEEFKELESEKEGKRFTIELKRRWHFF